MKYDHCDEDVPRGRVPQTQLLPVVKSLLMMLSSEHSSIPLNSNSNCQPSIDLYQNNGNILDLYEDICKGIDNTSKFRVRSSTTGH